MSTINDQYDNFMRSCPSGFGIAVIMQMDAMNADMCKRAVQEHKMWDSVSKREICEILKNLMYRAREHFTIQEMSEILDEIFKRYSKSNTLIETYCYDGDDTLFYMLSMINNIEMFDMIVSKLVDVVYSSEMFKILTTVRSIELFEHICRKYLSEKSEEDKRHWASYFKYLDNLQHNEQKMELLTNVVGLYGLI
jgi:hypothetical protein